MEKVSVDDQVYVYLEASKTHRVVALHDGWAWLKAEGDLAGRVELVANLRAEPTFPRVSRSGESHYLSVEMNECAGGGLGHEMTLGQARTLLERLQAVLA